MKTVVVFSSRKGNTKHVAEAIGRALGDRGTVELFEVTDAPSRLPEADLAFIGGPTEGHGASAPMAAYLDRLEADSVSGRLTAVFDTRLAWPLVVSGSAAQAIATRLRAFGARIVGDPGSFLVTRTPELKPGELERVATWVREISSLVAAGKVPA